MENENRGVQMQTVINAVMVLGVAFVVYKISKVFDTSKEVKDAQENTQKITSNAVMQSDYNYLKDKNKQPILSGQQMDIITKAIHDNMHFVGVGIRDTALYNAALGVRNSRQLGQIKQYYYIKYKIDMLQDMSATLIDNTINRWSANGVYNKIITYWNSLK